MVKHAAGDIEAGSEVRARLQPFGARGGATANFEDRGIRDVAKQVRLAFVQHFWAPVERRKVFGVLGVVVGGVVIPVGSVRLRWGSHGGRKSFAKKLGRVFAL